jgi:hypothetical protein
MKIVFTCQTCGSPVEYDLVSTKTHELRRYGVHHCECTQPRRTVSRPEPSHDSFAFETADEPQSASRWAFQPKVGPLQEAALGNV